MAEFWIDDKRQIMMTSSDPTREMLYELLLPMGFASDVLPTALINNFESFLEYLESGGDKTHMRNAVKGCVMAIKYLSTLDDDLDDVKRDLCIEVEWDDKDSERAEKLKLLFNLLEI